MWAVLVNSFDVGVGLNIFPGKPLRYPIVPYAILLGPIPNLHRIYSGAIREVYWLYNILYNPYTGLIPPPYRPNFFMDDAIGAV